MANNKIQVKRTNVSGRTANVTSSGNAQYIDAGELALNMADGILYTSNGSSLITVGANLVNQNVSNTLTVKAISANGSIGTSGQVLSTNGTAVYWTSTGSGGTIIQQQYTGDGSTTTFTFTSGYTANTLAVYLNGVLLRNGTEIDTTSGSTFTITPAPASGSLIDAIGMSGVISNIVNTSAQYTWSNTQTFSNNITVSGLLTSNYVGSSNSSLALAGMNTKGGAGYHDFMMVRNGNTSATNVNKWFRLNNIGTLEILNSAYSQAITTVDDTGNLTTSGYLNPQKWQAGQVIKDTMLSNAELTILTTTVATSTSDTDFISYSYTPVSSSSYLIIHVHVASYEAAKTGGSGNDSYFSRIKVDGNEITYASQYTRDTYTFRTGTLFPLTGRYTNSNTSAKSITVGVRRDTADDSINITNSVTALWMRITEVAR